MLMTTSKVLTVIAMMATLTGCAKDFPKQSMDSNVQSLQEILKNSIAEENDYDSRVQMASLYFSHNFIDETDELLSILVEENPEHAEAAAWYGANNCKISSRAIPWFMGIRKLYLTNKCLSEVEDALAKAPDDFTIRLISINTGLEVVMFDSYEKGMAELIKLRGEINVEPNKYPAGALSHYYMVESKLAELEGEIGIEKTYLTKIIELNADSTLVKYARIKMLSLANN